MVFYMTGVNGKLTQTVIEQTLLHNCVEGSRFPEAQVAKTRARRERGSWRHAKIRLGLGVFGGNH